MKNEYLLNFLNVPFTNSLFLGQFIRSVGKTYVQCADIGECFITASKIKDDDFEGWHKSWLSLAERVEGLGKDSLEKGHLISARESFLRASEYYRQSSFFLRTNLDDPQFIKVTLKSTETFVQATKLFETPIEIVKIPFEDGYLLGYFFHPQKPRRDGATIIIPSGYDSTAEENYSFGVKAALNRGYYALTFDGPGQGKVLYQYRLYMRPDFEKILSPVIDWVIEKPEVNKSKIGLIGRSFGGYLAPRAVAYGEKRIAALVCDPGQMDLAGELINFLPKEVLSMLESGNANGVNNYFEELLKKNKSRKFFFESRMTVHGNKTVFDWLTEMAKYSLKDKIDNIKCPTLILNNESDAISPVSGKTMFNALKGEKDFYSFRKEDGAGIHIEEGADGLFNCVVFNWLDNKLK